MLHFELADHQAIFEATLKAADGANLETRLWEHDHTLWDDSPEEISNRLGWLDIAERMSSEIANLQNFAEEIKASGITQVLLQGMGGSSLAPEVFSKVFGAADGFLTLDVLDSTDPEAVKASQDAHKPAGTLYIVSTKSGGTVETLSFFKTFFNQAVKELGENEAGKHFVAITDPGSKLVTLAEKHNFRRTFLSDPNIGGRYSALSYFGLVPAALLGADLRQVIERAMQMAEACSAEVPASENPGAQLGLALSSLAMLGRDKVTFIVPREIASFGDWVEQLIAESTGKSGKGILPVVGETLGETSVYGEDRVFVNLTLPGKQSNPAIEKLKAAGHPFVQIQWQDKADLGGQFFLWEFATAVASYGIGVHPFNQPDVEAAKVQSRHFVEAYTESGKLPASESETLSSRALNSFLESSNPGDYVALQAYVQPSDESSMMLQKLRQRIREKYHLASTMGYGPRFLHSTGQMHKGDGGNGLFVQFISANKDDLAIPSEAGSTDSEISYGILKQAQALGDAQALRDAGGRLLTFQLDEDFAAQLESLLKDFE